MICMVHAIVQELSKVTATCFEESHRQDKMPWAGIPAVEKTNRETHSFFSEMQVTYMSKHLLISGVQSNDSIDIYTEN